MPKPSPVVFAFLGSYVFAVGLLFRLYIRSDLKPKAYTHIAIRIIIGIAVAWAISALPVRFTKPVGGLGSTLLVLAFVIGFFPSTGFAVIFQFLRSQKLFVGRGPSGEGRFPLYLLDGMSIYTRNRLLQEGIENLENLAHSDVPELMLQTRIPLATLIDWIDQAILYLHVKVPSASGAAAEDPGEEKDADIKTLRSYGIRTATDLQRACKAAQKREMEKEFLSILGPKKEPKKLQVILDAIEDDEWMMHLWRYRDADRFADKIFTVEDFESQSQAPGKNPDECEVKDKKGKTGRKAADSSG
jgi:hypothetical protein